MATSLITAGMHWSRFYAIALGVRVINLVLVGWTFWSYEKEGISQFSNSLQQIASRQSTAELGTSSKIKLISRALKTKVTLIGALFVFAYQGAEVAEAGWVITYLIVSCWSDTGISTRILTLPNAGISEGGSNTRRICYIWVLGRDCHRPIRSDACCEGK